MVDHEVRPFSSTDSALYILTHNVVSQYTRLSMPRQISHALHIDALFAIASSPIKNFVVARVGSQILTITGPVNVGYEAGVTNALTNFIVLPSILANLIHVNAVVMAADCHQCSVWTKHRGLHITNYHYITLMSHNTNYNCNISSHCSSTILAVAPFYIHHII